jgi:type II secretory pathway pseudopilin PulG
MIEIALVVAVIAIVAGIMLSNINFSRFRLDAAARAVQNQIIAAQTTAVQRNRPVILTFMYNQGQFRLVVDLNSDGYWNSASETRVWRTLSEGAQFVTPPTTIDGATPYYATGPGIKFINAMGQTATCPTCPTFTLFPNGSASGDVIVYLGTSGGRTTDYRAIQVYGSTSRVHIWRMDSGGTWLQSDL